MIPRRAGSGHCSGSRVSSRFQWGRAVLFPFAATLAAELVIVAILVFSGIVELVGAFAMRHNGRLTWHVLFGLAALVAGAIGSVPRGGVRGHARSLLAQRSAWPGLAATALLRSLRLFKDR